MTSEILAAQSGYSFQREAVKAGAEAVRLALDGLGQPPQVIIMFASTLLAQDEVLAGAQQAALSAGGTGGIVGASSVAEISEFGALEHGVCALALGSPALTAAQGAASLTDLTPAEAGRRAVERAMERLGAAAGSVTPPRPVIALAFASLRHGDANRLTSGMTDALGPDVPLFAVGAAEPGHAQASREDAEPAPQGPAFGYAEGVAYENSVCVLLLAVDPLSPLRVGYATRHGFTPIGPTLTVDRADGPHVASIGGQGVLEFYAKYLGQDLRLTGHNVGPFALAVDPGDGDDAAADIVMPVDLDLAAGAVTFFPPVPLAGRSVRITRPSREHLLAASRAAASATVEALAGARPLASVLISSYLRRRILGTRIDRELAVVRDELGPEAAIIGAYAVGEIAPARRRDASERIEPPRSIDFTRTPEDESAMLPALADYKVSGPPLVSQPLTGTLTVLAFGDATQSMPDQAADSTRGISARLKRANTFRTTTRMTPGAIIERQQREIEYVRARLSDAEDMVEEIENLLYRTNRDLVEANGTLEAQRDQLERLSRTDTLTELPNRRQLFRLLDRALGEYARYRTTFAVAVIDIDHFKRVNDTYGHLAGDEVLRAVSRRIQHVLRGTDHVARYGGEEFVAVFPHTEIEGARHVTERIRTVIGSEPFSADELVLSVTVSAGVVAVDQVHAPTVDLLIGAADAVMYAAKQAGRDRVFTIEQAPPGTVSEPPPDGGEAS